MQIIIATSTALAISNTTNDIINEVFSDTNKRVTADDLVNNKYVNYSSNIVGDDVVLEINDECFYKYAAMYVRISKIIAPFIKPVLSLLDIVKTDLKDIERFMNTKK